MKSNGSTVQTINSTGATSGNHNISSSEIVTFDATTSTSTTTSNNNEEEDKEKEIFLSELGLSEPGLNRLIRASYKLLGLQTYFTAGVKEVRAWTVKIGATAPEGAGVIHTDFEKGFIKAEVISYQDYIDLSGEQKAKEAGKLRLEGKDYVLQDGDVVHFRFNV